MLNSSLYEDDLNKINMHKLPWEELERCNILITGGTGLVGSCLVDAFIYRNEHMNAGIGIWVLCRSKERAEAIFGAYLDKSYLHMVYQDVAQPIMIEEDMDYIIHAASKGDPKSFVNDPLGIMDANLLGMRRILEYAKTRKLKKIVYISSGEIYGMLQPGEHEQIEENMMGTLDTMNSRNCYGMSKRAAETMCTCAYEQYRIPTVVARLCHTYGPTMLADENRVIFQFIQNALNRQNIVLKSEGLQRRSYCYVADAVKGILTILLKGNCGEAYNVANAKSVISIRELANCISSLVGQQVIMETQTNSEKKGNSGIMHAVLDDKKLCDLGYVGEYDMTAGMERTMAVLREIAENRNGV